MRFSYSHISFVEEIEAYAKGSLLLIKLIYSFTCLLKIHVCVLCFFFFLMALLGIRNNGEFSHPDWSFLMRTEGSVELFLTSWLEII